MLWLSDKLLCCSKVLTLLTDAPLRGASRSQAEYGTVQMASAPPGTLPGALNAPGVRPAVCTCR